MRSRVFIDTAGWANLFVFTESYHQQATNWFLSARQNKIEMLTTNYVLTELVALLNSPLRVPRFRLFQYIDGIKSADYVQLEYIDATIDLAAWSLLKQREDKNWSLVDATSFVIMQHWEIQDALTTDIHFEQAGFTRLLKV